MKLILLALAAAGLAAPVLAADVGVSVSIGQPGFYGRIDIGGYPQPQLIYPQPMMIEPMPPNRPPIYLRVPPEHAKHWKKYCRQYNACGERVFFVHDNWYQQQYVPRFREQHRGHRDERDARDERGHRDEHRNERHNERPGEERGRER